MLAQATSRLLPAAWTASHALYPSIAIASAHTKRILCDAALRSQSSVDNNAVFIPNLTFQQTRSASTAVLQDEPRLPLTPKAAGTMPCDVEEVHDLKNGSVALHAGMSKAHSSTVPWLPADVQTVMKHHVYPKEYLESIKPKHLVPHKLHEKLAFHTIQTIRRMFDLATGYTHEGMTEALWLRRIIFLETVAGVPGMVAGMMRHLRSLRFMRRDNGWINTLLEEAENERMHLLTFMEMRKPGMLFRGAVIGAQGVMMTGFTLGYAISPKFCHALVGYLEEEAVKTYTHALEEIDAGKLWANKPAPPIAITYWWLPENATMRDLILAVRADEACHSHVNHTFARIPQDGPNPFTEKDSHMVP